MKKENILYIITAILFVLGMIYFAALDNRQTAIIFFGVSIITAVWGCYKRKHS